MLKTYMHNLMMFYIADTCGPHCGTNLYKDYQAD